MPSAKKHTIVPRDSVGLALDGLSKPLSLEQRLKKHRFLVPQILTNISSTAAALDLVLKEQAPSITKLKEVFLPPNEGRVRILGQKTGEGKEKQSHPRLELACRLLVKMGVDLTDDSIVEGTNTEEMRRSESYLLIRIPEWDRMILLCEEEGNRTFVIHSNKDPERYRSMSKNELMALKGIELEELAWCGPAEWEGELQALLQEDLSKREAPARGTPEKDYFNSFQWVRKDLEHFAKALGEAASVFTLNASNSSSLSAVTAKGELISWELYLSRAGVALGLAETNREARSHKALILSNLRAVAKYLDMTATYFENPEGVRYDLKEFEKLLPKGEDVLDLNTAKMRALKIKASNGETLTGDVYLKRAGTTLAALQKKAGYKPLDATYFEDLENLRKDFESLKEAQGLRVVQDLTSTVLTAVPEFTAANGKKVATGTYFYRAPESPARFIQSTIKRLGHEILDKDYFEKEDCVRHDLQAFSLELGLTDWKELTVSRMKGKKIIAHNGQELSRDQFLDRAGIELGFARTAEECRPHYGTILAKLKEYGVNDGSRTHDLQGHNLAL